MASWKLSRSGRRESGNESMWCLPLQVPTLRQNRAKGWGNLTPNIDLNRGAPRSDLGLPHPCRAFATGWGFGCSVNPKGWASPLASPRLQNPHPNVAKSATLELALSLSKEWGTLELFNSF